MLELLLCSLLTVFPDYLYRRYKQGKRLGKEITLYSVWFELRWGITSCVILTVALITVIFYNHPSTSNVTASFRTVSILPETIGRVSEVYVGVSDHVKKGQPILRLDDASQRAAVEIAQRRIQEIEAAKLVAQSDIAAAGGQSVQAAQALQQAVDELTTKQQLNARNPDVVARRDIERLQNIVDAREGALAAANAMLEGTKTRLERLLPAEQATAQATLEQAEAELAKTVVRAGVDGRLEQFTVRVGDLVNPMMRPAGLLIPDGAGRERLIAGFGQIEAQVMKPGMVAEATCISKPFTIIPMVVTYVQDYIAAGQFRAGEQLIDMQQTQAPGTITVFLEPLYEGGLDGVPPGSSCMANAYSSNHATLEKGGIGFFHAAYLHVVDTVALVHALLLRLQALILPVKTLVLNGH